MDFLATHHIKSDDNRAEGFVADKTWKVDMHGINGLVQQKKGWKVLMGLGLSSMKKRLS